MVGEANGTGGDLTDDEYAVLMIAGNDQSMMPIGRWEKPVQQLAVMGLLRKLDAFNYVITDNGRKLLADRGREEDEELQRAVGKLADDRHSRDTAMRSGEQAALHLANAARAAAKISGLDPNQECWTIGQAVVQRALELLK